MHVDKYQAGSEKTIKENICEVPTSEEDRLGTRESISSKKITQGAEARARWKTVRTARSLSPTYMFSNSGPVNIIVTTSGIVNLLLSLEQWKYECDPKLKM